MGPWDIWLQLLFIRRERLCEYGNMTVVYSYIELI